MNLLLVDDEIAMLHIMEKAIDWKKKGIQKVFTAYNTDLARDIISSSKIDLVICDIEMPKENGLSLIQWIQDMYPEIINIILTGYPDFNYARSAISLGVYRYLLKPIAFDELEETIASAVEKLEEYKTKNKPEADPEIADAVNTIKKYLESHYSEVITRKKIEELVHLNQDHINREFKKQTGYTLMEYVQHYRILMAKKMLRETTLSISEISIRTGYDSPAYFSKIFKKQTERTPLEYRAGLILSEMWKCGMIKPSKNTGGNTNEKENGSSSFDGGNDRITSCRMWGQQEFGQHKGRFCADNSIEPK